MVKECSQEFDLRVQFITFLNAFAHVWALAKSRLSWKGLHALSFLSSHLLNLLIGFRFGLPDFWFHVSFTDKIEEV